MRSQSEEHESDRQPAPMIAEDRKQPAPEGRSRPERTAREDRARQWWRADSVYGGIDALPASPDRIEASPQLVSAKAVRIRNTTGSWQRCRPTRAGS